MFDQQVAERAIYDFIAAIGLDPDDPTLEGTPRRVALAALDLYSGVGKDPVPAISNGEPIEGVYPGPVAVHGIPFSSVCEHHLLPFKGVATVGYLPGRRLAGLGDFDAAIRIIAARPQMQERLTDQIADAVQSALEPRGIIVELRAEHSCMWARGERTVGAIARSVAARGEFDLDGAYRIEALRLIGAVG